MTNGFYNTNDIDKAAFIHDAIYLAYNIVCHTKYKSETSSGREMDKSLTIRSVLREGLKRKVTLDVIDRFTYYNGVIRKEFCEYEIVFHYDWTFLYIFVSEDSFNDLIDKYKLKLTNW